jgi:antirestriction protein ArdC
MFTPASPPRWVPILKNGIRTWLKPSGDVDATRVALPLRHNGIPYRGINVLLLWSEAIDKGYASQKWMTFWQALELGGHVRTGEHGSQIAYADKITKTEENGKGEEVERAIPFMKLYTVFNAAQIEGLHAEYYARPEHRGEKLQLIAAAEQFFAATRAVIRHGGGKAYYAPGPDVIQLPEPVDGRSVFVTLHHAGSAETLNPDELPDVQQ